MLSIFKSMVLVGLTLSSVALQANADTEYDLLLKDGYVIDPANQLDGPYLAGSIC